MTTVLDPVIPADPNSREGWDKDEALRAPETSGVESMFSARKNPWHSIGQVIPEALRSSDIAKVLETAGMDWTVSKRPVRAAASKINDEVWGDYSLGTDDFFAIVRDDTDDILGVVKRAYQPFQNADALDLLNDILLSGDVTVETAGVLWGGRRVWVLANIPRDITIGGDVHVPYLCVSTTHDGSGSVRADLTLMRVECQNSLRWAIRNNHLEDALEKAGVAITGSPSWTHRHSANVKAKAADARRILGFANDFLDAYEAEIETLMAKVVSDREFEKLVKAVLPAGDDLTDRQRGNVEEKRDKVRALYESPIDGGKFKGTGWGAFQAFSSYDLWGADLREGEASRPTRQVVRLLDGTVEKRTTAVRDRIMGLGRR